MTGGKSGLTVAQHDLRTVRVDLGSARFLLRYGFSFDGYERLPESVAVAGTDATAFFLSSTVRDRIARTGVGFEVRRRWEVLQAGHLRLALTIDVPEAREGARRRPGRPDPSRSFRFLFPGVGSGPRVPDRGCAFRGERTSMPACVLLAAEDLGICAYVEPAGDGRALSVGIERASDDAGGLVRLVFETPARERFPAAGFASDPGDGTEEDTEGTGRLEQELTVQVAVGPPASVFESALASAIRRSGSPGQPRKWATREEVRSFLATHLVEEGGVCGLRVVPDSVVLSASAGAELAVLLCRIDGRDPETVQTALRLGDFALRGQHPAGLFYERYSLRERSWVGLRGLVPGRSARPPLLSTEESSRIAASLLDLEGELAALGAPASRYGLAARRMVDAFFDGRGRFTPPGAVMTPDCSAAAEGGRGAVRFLHPLLRIADRDDRERYRKAASRVLADWLGEPADPFDLPGSREGRGPDSRAALLLLEAALEATSRRVKVPACSALATLLLPWIYVGLEASRGPLTGAAAVVDSFARPRLRPRPCQIAYLCRRFAGLSKGSLRALLEDASRAAASSAGVLPLGCSFVARRQWEGGADAGRARRRRSAHSGGASACFEIGAVDARDFVTELAYSIRLEEERLW